MGVNPKKSDIRKLSLAVASKDDGGEELPVHDVVDDPLVPDAQPVTVVVSGELLDAGIRPEPRAWWWSRRGLRHHDVRVCSGQQG